MTRFTAIPGLAVIALFIPMTAQALVSYFSLSDFKIDKLSTRQTEREIWVDGEITNKAKNEALVVSHSVRCF